MCLGYTPTTFKYILYGGIDIDFPFCAIGLCQQQAILSSLPSFSKQLASDSKEMKLKLYNTVVKATLMYRTEYWCTSETDRKSLKNERNIRIPNRSLQWTPQGRQRSDISDDTKRSKERMLHKE
ncbi:hypothetical protein BpHYR1_006963 [Brachionus plicatilis]|uniref:Uncharacterized protein n=1 Tax=Brachionus plicatilis TaxID=10195 RepID=A0A3M7PI63_BRAPC|nr:hypothetical protein BpHYR1_006963 [Brachionus plicatilis]